MQHNFQMLSETLHCIVCKNKTEALDKRNCLKKILIVIVVDMFDTELRTKLPIP